MVDDENIKVNLQPNTIKYIALIISYIAFTLLLAYVGFQYGQMTLCEANNGTLLENSQCANIILIDCIQYPEDAYCTPTEQFNGFLGAGTPN